MWIRSRRSRSARLLTVAWSFFAALLLGSPSAAAEDAAAEIRSCMAGNEPKETSTQTVLMRATDRMGAVTDTRANLYWQKGDDGLSSLMVRLFDPPDMRGAGLLILEKAERSDMFLYMPDVGRSRRVTKHMAGGSLFGTDFTYEEFERVYGMVEDGQSKRLEDEVLEQRPVFVMEGVPSAEQESQYHRVVVFVDKETCVPLKMEFYEIGDRLRKIIRTDPAKILTFGSVRVPSLLEAQDVRDGTSSQLIIEKVLVDEGIPRKYFTIRHLESGRD